MDKVSVRVNRVDANLDEVFLYRDEPYVNRTVYAKTGLFTPGESTEEEITKIEQESKAILDKEHADKLAAEEADRKRLAKEAEKADKPKAAKENK